MAYVAILTINPILKKFILHDYIKNVAQSKYSLKDLSNWKSTPMFSQTPHKTSFEFWKKIGFDEFENTVFVSKNGFTVHLLLKHS